MAREFPTTELEMGRVADEFDKGDGMISAKEFMNALRFDPKKRRYEPKSETERIHQEIEKEVAKCTVSLAHILSILLHKKMTAI
jgi:Ca2+-binding EF-hand superfamily protein